MSKKTYYVQYEKVSYHVIEVEADSTEEANEIAEAADESEFTETDGSGHWNHEDTEEKTD